MYVALALIGFGVADLGCRLPQTKNKNLQVALASLAGAAVASVLAALGGASLGGVIATAVIGFLVLLAWDAWDTDDGEGATAAENHTKEERKPAWPLVVPALSIVVLIALSGSTGDVRGDLASWYGDLGFPFVGDVPPDQALMAVGALLFLLATGNRVVRLTLAAVGSPPDRGEDKLRGGRLIGPMERLLVAGALVSGGLAGAGFVIAAKGLLRFRELRPDGEKSADGSPADGSIDAITEYFLVGTFASILLACGGSLLVLGAG